MITHLNTLVSLSRTFPFDGGRQTTRREAAQQLRRWLYLEVQGGCIRYWPLFRICTVEVHGVGGSPQVSYLAVLRLIQLNYIRFEDVDQYEEVGVDEVELVECNETGDSLVEELTDSDIIDSEPTFTHELGLSPMFFGAILPMMKQCNGCGQEQCRCACRTYPSIPRSPTLAGLG